MNLHFIKNGLIFLFCWLAGVGLSWAGDLIQPESRYSAREVIEIQLLGLQAEDRMLGIEQVWLFAHPANKAMTGPLARFRGLFDNPAYAPLIGHKSHALTMMASPDGTAQFIVRIMAEDGLSYAYLWQLQKVTDGPQADIWMTVAVSAPRTGAGS